MKYKILQDENMQYLTRFNSITLYRIEALISFGDVKAGDKGGFIQSIENLSQSGDCWIYDQAISIQGSRVIDSGKMKTFSIIEGDCVLGQKGLMEGRSRGGGRAVILGKMSDNSLALESSVVEPQAQMAQEGSICGTAKLRSTVPLLHPLSIRSGIIGNAEVAADSLDRSRSLSVSDRFTPMNVSRGSLPEALDNFSSETTEPPSPSPSPSAVRQKSPLVDPNDIRDI